MAGERGRRVGGQAAVQEGFEVLGRGTALRVGVHEESSGRPARGGSRPRDRRQAEDGQEERRREVALLNQTPGRRATLFRGGLESGVQPLPPAPSPKRRGGGR